MNISKGKQKGLEAIADSRGIIAALAIDQRSALRKLFAAATGVAGRPNCAWTFSNNLRRR